MTLGEKLYYFRKRAKLSQDNVAEYLSVSRQAVSKWENDQSRPDTDNLIKLAEIYNITLDELVGKRTPVSNNDKRLCVYCHKPATFYYEDNPYCSNECQIKYGLEMKSVSKNLKWFYLGTVISILVLLICAFYPNEIVQLKGVGIGMMLMGTVIVLFPYCTPLTYDLFGFKKTQILGRLAGMITELLGLWIFFFG